MVTATESFKSLNNLNPRFMNEMFGTKIFHTIYDIRTI